MTTVKLRLPVVELDATPLPVQGDIVVFGQKEAFLIARTDGIGGKNNGLKVISLKDGNRYSDIDSLEDVMESLEQSLGPCRIAKAAHISFEF
jgi:hypothetical protein